jgi:hypothetical protein
MSQRPDPDRIPASGDDEPKVSSYAAEAPALIQRGYCPLPTPNGQKRPDLGTWKEWKDGRLPSPEQVAKWWSDDATREIGIVIPPGCCGFEIEGKRNGAHPDVDPEARARIVEGLRTAGVLDRLPCYTTPSGGRRYVARVLRGWKWERKSLAREGLGLFVAGDFVKCPPSGGYRFQRSLPPVLQLPLMPLEVLAIFERDGPEAKASGTDSTMRETAERDHSVAPGGRFEMTAEELVPWREWLPDLRVTSSGGIALCPFHPDHEPSLSIYRDRRGYLRYNCRAQCDGSRHEVKRNGEVVAVVHTGPLGRLKRKIAISRGLFPYEALRDHIRSLRLPANAEAIALAVISVARQRGIAPYASIGISYRVLARQSELENVKEGGQLSGGGRLIKPALLAFQACGGFVEIGTSYAQAAASGGHAQPTKIGLGALLPREGRGIGAIPSTVEPSTFDTTRTQTYSNVEGAQSDVEAHSDVAGQPEVDGLGESVTL